MEILVHISAPTSRKDDERYRALAEAYIDFELAGDFTAKFKSREDAEKGSDQPQAGVLQRDRNWNRDGPAPDHLGNGSSSSAHGHNDVDRVDSAGGKGATRGTAQHNSIAGTISRTSHMAHGAIALARFEAAPDFGSLGTSTQTTQLSEDIDAIPELHEQPSSNRSWHENVGLQRPDSQVFIENTQQGIAALESDLLSSFPDDWLSSNPMESSPISERPSKRPRLSRNSEANKSYDDTQMDKTNSLSLRMSHEFQGSTDSQIPSSQLPEDYGLGDWRTPVSSMGAPISSLNSQSEGDVDPALMIAHNALPPSSVEEPARTTRSNCDRTSETISSLSQSSPRDDVNDIQDPVSQVEQIASTSPVKERSEKLEAIPDGFVHHNEDPVNYDFASLPIKLSSPPPAAGFKTSFNEMTESLEVIAKSVRLEKHFRPEFVSRPINDTDRGCWMLDTSSWELKRQHEFWIEMQDLLNEGCLGNVWCQRNIPDDTTSNVTDGKEAEGLGMVRLFCWGQVVPHIWLVLLIRSHREVKKSKARWTVGPSDDLEVVVQMP